MLTITREQQLPGPEGALQPRVTVAVVIFSVRPGDEQGLELKVLLVRRAVKPFKGWWALPGGHLWGDESLEQAATRQLVEKTNLRASYLEQLYTFAEGEAGKPLSALVVSYYALVRTDDVEIAAGRKTMEADWFGVERLPKGLAFRNEEIIDYALWRLRNKIEYAHVAFQFLPATFTLAQLRSVYEVILGRKIDPTNFRRHVEMTGTIVPTEERLAGGRHRPPRLYRCGVQPSALYQGPRA